jgi:hypothetical protein
VIGDSKVGELYQEVITSLGVEFSKAKTHKSPRFFEFAKRKFLDDVEISSFPISSLKESMKSFGMISVVLLEANGRGWNFPDIPSCVSKFFAVVMQRNSTYQKKVEERS